MQRADAGSAALLGDLVRLTCRVMSAQPVAYVCTYVRIHSHVLGDVDNSEIRHGAVQVQGHVKVMRPKHAHVEDLS